ncbi:hypothetical protein NIES4073_23880 [Kalymmatonema gypsitolerans NIES-4073]|nr:hypothetical protein NIES4073_23880 [Scytonema sp. NIES-4073]
MARLYTISRVFTQYGTSLDNLPEPIKPKFKDKYHLELLL